MHQAIRPKKFLGQHFLRDDNIARKIAESLSGFGDYKKILEIGPGTGVLTKFLLDQGDYEWHGVELDRDSIVYLREQYPAIAERLVEADFLRMSLSDIARGEPLGIIGNFPYNISSQIVFKVLEYRDQVPELVGMFQKEMAQRIAAPSGNKIYGIMSVLAQAFYHVEYLFQVDEQVFFPPPKVKSAVIRMKRKDAPLPCEPRKLFMVVKAAFNQRRKTLHNSLKGLQINWEALPEDFPKRRPEQIKLEEFYLLAQQAGLGEQ
ncbi:MAG: 16S rRNA (adenine(1518)-N(6)/adenine(1519)-N(6))-dimethyltransferase RsmA [Bacteroidales bacterium]|jgi:16S rRNA (adenine1518-N6/adenine1519-N6)-dimethyltransferase|nr:16S rRNA (adenine(1518)-N(6)/adenine(1519)-N(6))-dimethyltransferase RsmA [Bacteroidales bacterium]NLM91596.1 16S rRNA (adenine(1518)-N(6)/adenine(1519)-N(6))-dimethyltransferase RsmA [Bacteroidales bacterium]